MLYLLFREARSVSLFAARVLDESLEGSVACTPLRNRYKKRYELPDFGENSAGNVLTSLQVVHQFPSCAETAQTRSVNHSPSTLSHYRHGKNTRRGARRSLVLQQADLPALLPPPIYPLLHPTANY